MGQIGQVIAADAKVTLEDEDKASLRGSRRRVRHHFPLVGIIFLIIILVFFGGFRCWRCCLAGTCSRADSAADPALEVAAVGAAALAAVVVAEVARDLVALAAAVLAAAGPEAMVVGGQGSGVGSRDELSSAEGSGTGILELF